MNDHITWLQSTAFSFYVVQGEKTALIELGTSPIVSELLFYLENELKIFRVDFLIPPHSHFDHIGGVTRLKKHYNAPVVTSKKSLAVFTPDMIEIYRKTMQKLTENPLYKLGFPKADMIVEFDEVPIETFAEEGLVLSLGNKELVFYETPGHSDCSMSILCRDCGTMFISDAAGAPLPSGKHWPTAYVNRGQYENSLRKIQKLKPAAIGMGHTGCLTGALNVHDYLDRTLGETEKYFLHLSELKKIHEEDEIHKILFQEFSGDLGTYIQPGIFKWGNRAMLQQIQP